MSNVFTHVKRKSLTRRFVLVTTRVVTAKNMKAAISKQPGQVACIEIDEGCVPQGGIIHEDFAILMEEATGLDRQQ
jgi:hypothetical protein